MVIDYPCVEFDDVSFSRFGFIMRTDRQTDRITDRGVSNNEREDSA